MTLRLMVVVHTAECNLFGRAYKWIGQFYSLADYKIA